MSAVNWEHSSWKCLSLVMNKSSISCTQRSTYSQILCYALEWWTRTQSQTLHGKTDWSGSKNYHNTELWTELMVSQWNSRGTSSQDSTTLELCTEVQELLSRLSVTPEKFTRRIIFMSMFNDISWWSKDKKKECESSAQLVSLHAKRFGARQWSFLGLGKTLEQEMEKAAKSYKAKTGVERDGLGPGLFSSWDFISLISMVDSHTMRMGLSVQLTDGTVWTLRLWLLLNDLKMFLSEDLTSLLSKRKLRMFFSASESLEKVPCSFSNATCVRFVPETHNFPFIQLVFSLVRNIFCDTYVSLSLLDFRLCECVASIWKQKHWCESVITLARTAKERQ